MTPLRVGAMVAGAVVTALAASLAPLLIYALSLALFGLPHVLAELRYVDARFHARVTRTLGLQLGLWLGFLVLVRGLAVAGVLSPAVSAVASLVALLGLVVAPLVGGPGRSAPRRSGFLWVVAAGVALVLTVGLATGAAATLVMLAVLHNLTPVAFLAERLQGRRRRQVMLLCIACFGVVPAILLTGLPQAWLAELGWLNLDASLLAIGPLSAHLGVFVPSGLIESRVALPLFVAAAYLQCLHYFVVLHVLPRFERDRSTWATWPTGRTLTFGIGVAGVIFFVGFALSFGDARAVYGVFAAIHAWIEVPLLLLALAVPAAGSSEVKVSTA